MELVVNFSVVLLLCGKENLFKGVLSETNESFRSDSPQRISPFERSLHLEAASCVLGWPRHNQRLTTRFLRFVSATPRSSDLLQPQSNVGSLSVPCACGVENSRYLTEFQS